MSFVPVVRNQGTLLGYTLEDIVPQDAQCRFVLALVRRLDLSELRGRYSDQGAQAYDPAMMLACWFYAYCEGITSTRALEQRCTRDLHFIYLSAHLKPDHTSFSRFRKKNLDLMGSYFMEIVRLAAAEGVSGFALQAVDGTRIQAASSAKHLRSEDDLDRYLEAARAEVSRYMRECAEMDEREPPSGDDDPGADERRALEAEIARARAEEALLVERKAQLVARKATLKAEHRGRHQINMSEPEACALDKVNGTSRLPAYNAQVVVDVETHLITACDAVQDRNDKRQFAPMHRRVEATLGTDGSRRFVGDAGYHSLEQLAYIEHEQVDAVLADPTPRNRSPRGAEALPRGAEALPPGDGGFSRSDFAYDVEADQYTCPAEQKLTYRRTEKWRSRRRRVYQAAACGGCVLKAHCLGTALGPRRILRDEAEHLAEAMHLRLRREEARSRMRARGASVEPVIGNLKANLGFRRFSLRGLGQVKGELYLMAIAHNINKLFVLAQQGALRALVARLRAVLSRLRRPYRRLGLQ